MSIVYPKHRRSTKNDYTWGRAVKVTKADGTVTWEKPKNQKRNAKRFAKRDYK